MPRTLAQIMAEREATYAPQRQLVAKQQALLPGEEQAAVGGLEQAKTNAFGDITNEAARRGLSYSGMPIAEQSRYVGERYLPALAGVKSEFGNRRLKLEEALLGINQNQAKEASSILAGEQEAERDAAYKAQQLALDRERINASRTKASQPSAADKATGIRASLNQDLAQAFSNFGARPRFFTEQQIIPRLVAAYPEIDQQTLLKTIYAYRKGLGYN